VLTKRSPAGNEIELSFDIGSYSKSYGGMLVVNGPGWFARAVLPVTAWSDSCAAYPIVNGDVWQQILENVRVAVEFYEQSFIREIEAIFSSTPRR
jgi:hypothetical protein